MTHLAINQISKTRTNKPRERFDFTAKELLADRRRMKPRSKKLPKIPRPRSVKLLQRRYYQMLRQVILAMRASIEKNVLPYIDGIVQMANFSRPGKVDSHARADAYSDEIAFIIQLAKIQLLRQFPESFYKDLATTIALATDDFSYQNINTIFEKVFGSSYSRFEPWVTQEVKGFVKANVDLITSIESTYFSKVEGIILRGAQKGKLSKDIGKEIKAEFGVTDRRAAFIARDQVAKFNGNLTQLRQTQAGISKYEWQTSEDERVRDSHRELNGKIFSWDDPPEVGNPGEDFNCRCVAIPVFEEPAADAPE